MPNPNTSENMSFQARSKPAHAPSPAWRPIAAAAAAGLVASAICVQMSSRRAEREHPSTGKFITIEGVRLHFIDTGGNDPVLVLLHGNGAMIADMEISGLVDAASKRYRVVVFDRPGYGYSERPRDRTWGPKEQADLLRRAFAQLGISRPLIFGHSWGAQVALALALDHPDSVGGLVLASGYYFPTARADAITAAPAAAPIVGELWRNTLSPLIGRLLAPRAFRKMFGPQTVPTRFSAEFPVGLALRPAQMRASSEETVAMVPASVELQRRYHELQLPVGIVVGEEDRIVDPGAQSKRLHDAITQSEILVLPGLGHMLHHFAPDRVVAAIDNVAARARLQA
jgi:pimeloyl-ACP methyl ester carboxylesterase